MGKEEMEFIVSGVCGGGKGARWNYPVIAEIVEKTVKEAVEKNIDEARRVAASTSKYAKVKLYIRKKLVQKIAERGKSGSLPSYDIQVYHIKEAIKQHLGLKTRREGEDIVIYLTPSDMQRYLNEVEEKRKEKEEEC